MCSVLTLCLQGAEGEGVNRLWQRLGATDVLVLALMLLTSEKPIDQAVKEKVECSRHNYFKNYQ